MKNIEFEPEFEPEINQEKPVEINPEEDEEPLFDPISQTTGEPPIIKVMGVGGGGGNAVLHMYKSGIVGVDYMLCNTDSQALQNSPIPIKIQLGTGLGAGAVPEVAREAALQSEERIRESLEGTKMLFITAGMGGGTGTGASPVVASIARDMDILTVGIVTYPFEFEGKDKFKVSDEGISELRQEVDALIVIKNECLKNYYPDLTFSNAFAKSDDVLLIAAKSIAELITIHGTINVDFNDVKTILKNSGTAIIGAGEANGENRAEEAIKMAIASPLLEQRSIYGAESVLLFISYGSGEYEVRMDEFTEITDYLEKETSNISEKFIWGHGPDDSLGDKLRVTIIATGFHEQAPLPRQTAKVGNEEPSIEVKTLGDDDFQQENDKEAEREAKQFSRPTLNRYRVESLDNDRLRNMTDKEMESYLKIPRYKKTQDTDSYDCSPYRAGVGGIRKDASAYLQSRESID